MNYKKGEWVRLEENNEFSGAIYEVMDYYHLLNTYHLKNIDNSEHVFAPDYMVIGAEDLLEMDDLLGNKQTLKQLKREKVVRNMSDKINNLLDAYNLFIYLGETMNDENFLHHAANIMNELKKENYEYNVNISFEEIEGD